MAGARTAVLDPRGIRGYFWGPLLSNFSPPQGSLSPVTSGPGTQKENLEMEMQESNQQWTTQSESTLFPCTAGPCWLLYTPSTKFQRDTPNQKNSNAINNFECGLPELNWRYHERPYYAKPPLHAGSCIQPSFKNTPQAVSVSKSGLQNKLPEVCRNRTSSLHYLQAVTSPLHKNVQTCPRMQCAGVEPAGRFQSRRYATTAFLSISKSRHLVLAIIKPLSTQGKNSNAINNFECSLPESNWRYHERPYYAKPPCSIQPL
ncbi:hypothetical protein FB451DRAFT_1474171 [Mycena latifolia]|nr:hypothetical protein FB451DRAFT_1474171 [Mycena latifolia]